MVAETAQQKAQREWNERATRDANRREQGVGVKWEEPLNPNQPYVDGVQKEMGNYLQQEPYDPFNPERGGPVGNYGFGAGPAFGGKQDEIAKQFAEQEQLQNPVAQGQQQQQQQQQGQGQPQKQGQAGQSFPLGQRPSHLKGNAPPSTGGKWLGGKEAPTTQELSRQGPDFQSGGNPFAAIAQNMGVEGSRPTQGQGQGQQQGQEQGQAPPGMAGKGRGGTQLSMTQDLSRQEPDFQSGGNPFASIAQNMGVEGSRPTQGQAPPNTGGKGQQLTNEHQRRQQAAPQYSRQTGSRGRQQRGPLANMNAKKAPMGGGSGDSNG
jgi:hypothetical protein